MVTVPHDTIPSVLPNGGGTPTFHPNIPEQAFGASVISKGLGQVGAGLQDVSNVLAENALRMQAITNKATVDNATTAYMEKVNDYNYNPKTGYYGLKEKAAVDAYPQAQSDLADIRSSIASSLPNPMAQQMFDTDSRRIESMTLGEMSRHAAQEQKSWVKNSSLSRVEMDGQTASLNWNNEDQFQQALADADKNVMAVADSEHWGEDETKAAMLKVSNQFYGQRIKMAMNHDLSAAQALYDKHLDQLNPDDAITLGHALIQGQKPLLAAAIGDEVFKSIFNGPQADNTEGFATRLVGSEKAAPGRPTKNPNSTADGDGQFVDGTWMHLIEKYRPDLMVGKSKEQILALRQDPRLSLQMTQNYAEENAGILGAAKTSSGAPLPVNAATLAMAHKLGPGDAIKVLQAKDDAPLSSVLSPAVMAANPYLGRAGTAGNLVRRMVGQFGLGSVSQGAPALQDMEAKLPTALQAVDDLVTQRYGNDPDYAQIKDSAEARLMGQFSRQKSAQDAVISQARQNVIGAIAGGQDGKGPKPTDLAGLFAIAPTLSADWAKLTAEDQRGFTQLLNNNNFTTPKEMTPDQVTQYQRLRGMQYNDPAAFASQDIIGKGFPTAYVTQMLDDQAKIRAGREDPHKDVINNAMGRVNAYLKANAIDDLTGPSAADKRNQLYGVMVDELHTYMQIHAQAPDNKTVDDMIASSFSKVATDNGIFGSGIGKNSIFQFQRGAPQLIPGVPNDKAVQIANAIQRARGRTPSEAEIGQFYARHRGQF